MAEGCGEGREGVTREGGEGSGGEGRERVVREWKGWRGKGMGGGGVREWYSLIQNGTVDTD